MRRFVPSLVVALGALGLTAGCSSSTPTTPTPPVATVDAFTQRLTPNGTAIFPFAEVTAGTVTATLTTVAPDSGLSLQIELGTWDGTSCSSVTRTNPAVQGATVTALANAGGNLCAMVSDANGVITTSESVTITVSHF